MQNQHDEENQLANLHAELQLLVRLEKRNDSSEPQQPDDLEQPQELQVRRVGRQQQRYHFERQRRNQVDAEPAVQHVVDRYFICRRAQLRPCASLGTSSGS